MVLKENIVKFQPNNFKVNLGINRLLDDIRMKDPQAIC